ncbi:TPA: ATPase [bacterium]|nr:ATPase [bacterium]
MIKDLVIKNFKTIKDLELNCKRVNIFIGRPNAGKSNILESIGIFSLPYGELKDFIRFENMIDLFYDQILDEKIEIGADDKCVEVRFEDGQFVGSGREVSFQFSYNGEGAVSYSADSPFKFYRFKVIERFAGREANFLRPPRGENLLMMLLTNKDLKRTVADIFSEFGLKVILKPQEYKIELQKEVEGVGISYPYSLVSDTLQRVVFHLLAIETNKDSILIFEEPEAHSFPYYTKFLSERIALDKTNQYFISTHNPYLLLPLLGKAEKDEVNVFVTYFKEYQTKVKPLAEEKIQKILDLDIDLFFNLDRFLEK